MLRTVSRRIRRITPSGLCFCPSPCAFLPVTSYLPLGTSGPGGILGFCPLLFMFLTLLFQVLTLALCMLASFLDQKVGVSNPASPCLPSSLAGPLFCLLSVGNLTHLVLYLRKDQIVISVLYTGSEVTRRKKVHQASCWVSLVYSFKKRLLSTKCVPGTQLSKELPQ